MAMKNGHRGMPARADVGILASDWGSRSYSKVGTISRERHCANAHVTVGAESEPVDRWRWHEVGVMTHKVRDWRVDLIEAHPGIFHPPAGHPEAAQAYPECGEGWRDLLDHACARIEAALTDDDTFTAKQIKQKYATLRFYWGGRLSSEAAAKVGEAIDLAEARSACTCETCGEVGRLFNDNGCFRTACDQHANGQPVAEKTGWENVTISRVDAGGSKTVIVKRRRYVRETDSFVEIDPLIIDEGG